MTLAPIVLFAYNRPWHTRQTLESLSKNYLANESELIVYVDGPKSNAAPEQVENIEKVRELVKQQNWCKKLTVHISERNQGLANSVIKGVTDTLRSFERVIVVEDDMVFSPYFLQFMNEGLEKYKYTEEVISIHGYCVPIEFTQPVFFLRGADCWGWATWRRGWEQFNPDADFLLGQLKKRKLQYSFDLYGNYEYTKMLQYQTEGKVDSWAIRWYASAFLANKLTLYPSKSLVRNIGGDGSGIHTIDERLINEPLYQQRVEVLETPLSENEKAKNLIGNYHYRTMGIRERFKKWVKTNILQAY
jgi:glycosyltransferase involved in cell wall biosynthesis